MLLQSKKVFDERTNQLGSLMKEVTVTLKAARPTSFLDTYNTDVVGSGMMHAIVEAGKKKVEVEQATAVLSPCTRAVVMGGIKRATNC